MIKENKKAIYNLTWELVVLVIIIAIGVASVIIMRQSSSVGMSAWQKIKDLNPFV